MTNTDKAKAILVFSIPYVVAAGVVYVIEALLQLNIGSLAMIGILFIAMTAFEIGPANTLREKLYNALSVTHTNRKYTSYTSPR